MGYITTNNYIQPLRSFYYVQSFSVQILGTVDATSTEELLKAINTALGSIAKFKIKAVSHDKWVDGYTGDDRFFGEDGKEIVETATPEQIPTETEVVEE